MDRVSIERMCAGREFQVEGADTEKAREEKLLVTVTVHIPDANAIYRMSPKLSCVWIKPTKSGCHGNVPCEIERLMSDSSSTAA